LRAPLPHHRGYSPYSAVSNSRQRGYPRQGSLLFKRRERLWLRARTRSGSAFAGCAEAQRRPRSLIEQALGSPPPCCRFTPIELAQTAPWLLNSALLRSIRIPAARADPGPHGETSQRHFRCIRYAKIPSDLATAPAAHGCCGRELVQSKSKLRNFGRPRRFLYELFRCTLPTPLARACVPCRHGCNPATGEAIKIKASKKAAFRAAA
jgi:hypothetical protein